METIGKSIIRSLASFIFISLIISSCEKDDHLDQFEKLNEKPTQQNFDFEQFGKTHNAYLNFVMEIENNQDPKARFHHGKTFVDPTFGSFNTDLTWEDLDKSMDFHKRRVESILNGSYNATTEKLSPAMTSFLDKLSKTVKHAVDNKLSVEEFLKLIPEIEDEVLTSQIIEIDLNNGISNDGAAMLAITSILKYSTKYWIHEEAKAAGGGNGDIIILGRKGIWRALADAWGYVSAWTNNGDGSYSWDHGSALVNADCVSDKVREN